MRRWQRPLRSKEPRGRRDLGPLYGFWCAFARVRLPSSLRRDVCAGYELELSNGLYDTVP